MLVAVQAKTAESAGLEIVGGGGGGGITTDETYRKEREREQMCVSGGAVVAAVKVQVDATHSPWQRQKSAEHKLLPEVYR